jgi:thiol-disulfide isomerase/thioredoxin
LRVLGILLLLAYGAGCGKATTSGTIAEQVAPDFALPDLDGKVVHLSDSVGKVRLVSFWATWCAPCREEIPALKELHQTYASRGFTLLAISMDEEGVEVVAPFVRDYSIPYTTLIGNDEVAQAFGGVVGLPTAFIVDRNGKIVDSFVGAVPRKILESKIQEVLGNAV